MESNAKPCLCAWAEALVRMVRTEVEVVEAMVLVEHLSRDNALVALEGAFLLGELPTRSPVVPWGAHGPFLSADAP